MRKIKLYIAMSLNGKIARPNGDVDWLDLIPNPDGSDYGYKEFMSTIDTTLMGSKTYKQILSWGIEFPYKDKKNYVFTRSTDIEGSEYAKIVSEKHLDMVRELKMQIGKDIWLIGGAKLNTSLLNENLIDEIHIFIMPIILSEGIDIFDTLKRETGLTLISSKNYSSGAAEIIYKLN